MMPSPEEIIELIEEDDMLGYCLECGFTQECVEPDARGYVCDNCGQPKVYGAEELLFMTEG